MYLYEMIRIIGETPVIITNIHFFVKILEIFIK
jgi:hypothetical protein